MSEIVSKIKSLGAPTKIVLVVVVLLLIGSCSSSLGNQQTASSVGNQIGKAAVASDEQADAGLPDVELQQTTNVLEYSAKTVDPLTLVKCSDSDVRVFSQGSIDLSRLGDQEVVYLLKLDDATDERKMTFSVRDTKAPDITFAAAEVSVNQGESFDPLANISSVKDPVDGDLTRVDAEPAAIGASSEAEVGSSSAAAASATSASASADSASASASAPAASASATSASASAPDSSDSSASAATSASAGKAYETGWYLVESAVDTATPGQYTVSVTASDIHGNRASKSYKVTVVEVAQEPAAAVAEAAAPAPAAPETHAYVLNTKSKKFHYSWCSSVGQMRAKNRQDVEATRDEVVSWGYSPCQRCNP